MFASSTDYECPGVGNVVTGDFDGDGNVDIAVGGSEGQFCILFNQGGGAFGAPHIVNVQATTEPASGVAAFLQEADVNGDGLADLLVGSFGGVYLALGQSGQTFTTPVSLNAGCASSHFFWLGDFRANGGLDVASEDDGAKVQYLTVVSYLQPGGGPSQSDAFYMGDLLLAFAADMNGDGRADLVGEGEGGVAIALSGGAGIPTSQQVFGAPNDNSGGPGLFPVDMNGDGVVDVVSFLERTQVAVLLTNPDGSLQAPVVSSIQPTNNFISAVAFGDLDGDGVPDCLAITSTQVLVLHGDKSGAFSSWSSNLTISMIANNVLPHAALSDLDGRGKLDLIDADWGTTRVFLRD